jgi:hypothetical protein
MTRSARVSGKNLQCQWMAAIHEGHVFAPEINATLREKRVLPEGS